MKKMIAILVVSAVLSTGCSSTSDDYVDPLSEFRAVCQDLTRLIQDQLIVATLGGQDAPDSEKSIYLTAIADIYLSQPYLIDTYNNVVTFRIMSFVNDIYTNNQNMTINVANDQYVFESEDTITIEGNLENTSAQLTYNPERETWLFIGKRGGVANGSLSEKEPKNVWIKQEGAIVNRTTFYVSTIFHYEEENGGTTHTTNGIVIYGTSQNPSLDMSGKNVSCQSNCIDTVYNQLFANGITSGWEDWDDFKSYPTPGESIDYEISVD